jgi:catechol 2,3-dioxygenase-like lactoylglutathione lyase family enzyme
LLQTERIEEAAAYYEGRLGLTRFMDEPDMIGLEADGFRLFLDRAPAYGPVLEFQVDDLEAAKRALIEAGGAIDEENPAIPRCYVTDPFGLTYNLAQRPAE